MDRLLTKYGLNRSIVEIWKKEEGEHLLPIQISAIEDYGLLDGENILITAPSSSGKTFVGEIAAISSYYRSKKTIFLVPMKAIAEE